MMVEISSPCSNHTGVSAICGARSLLVKGSADGCTAGRMNMPQKNPHGPKSLCQIVQRNLLSIALFHDREGEARIKIGQLNIPNPRRRGVLGEVVAAGVEIETEPIQTPRRSRHRGRTYANRTHSDPNSHPRTRPHALPFRSARNGYAGQREQLEALWTGPIICILPIVRPGTGACCLKHTGSWFTMPTLNTHSRPASVIASLEFLDSRPHDEHPETDSKY